MATRKASNTARKPRLSKADEMLSGKPASTKPEKRLLTQEFATPEFAGIRTLWVDAVAPGLTPQRLATILHGAEQGNIRDYLTLAEDMEERETHYASVLSTRKLAIGGVAPIVEAAGEDARSVEIADAIEDLIALPVFEQLVQDLCDGIGKGYSVSEIIWETSAKQWAPVDYRWRDPRFFTFDLVTRSELRLVTAENPAFGDPLPAYKFIRHVPRLKSGIPIRGGLAKAAAWSFVFKSYSLKDWVAFAEVYGMPIRVGKYAPSATEADRRALLGAVRNIGSDAAAIIPSTMEMEFVETTKGSSGSAVFKDLCEYLDKQVSKRVLGQTMTTDHGSSMAQAKVHENVRHDILIFDTRQLAATLNRDLVKPFVDLNFGPQKAYPKIALPVPKSEDLKALASNLKTIVPLGVRVREQEVRDRFGFTEPNDGDAVLSPNGLARFERDQELELPRPAGQTDAEADAEDEPDADDLSMEGEDGEKPAKKAKNRKQPKARKPRKGKPAKAANRAHNHNHAETDELDRIRDMALGDWQRQVDPMLKPLRDLVNKATSYEDVLKGLPKAMQKMDVTAFMQTLAASMAIGRGLGDAGTTAHKE